VNLQHDYSGTMPLDHRPYRCWTIYTSNFTRDHGVSRLYIYRSV